MGSIHRVEQRERHFSLDNLATLIRRSAGSSTFSGIAAHMVQLLHGRTDSCTRIECGLMQVQMSRTSCSIRRCYRRRASLSCSTASKAKRSVRNILRRSSTFMKRQLSATTARSLLRILNVRSVSVACSTVSRPCYIPRCRPEGDWCCRALQGSGQEDPGLVKEGKVGGC